jgi:hypothetical protein
MAKSKPVTKRPVTPGLHAQNVRRATAGAKARWGKRKKIQSADPAEVAAFMREHDEHSAEIIDKHKDDLGIAGWVDVKKILEVKKLALDNSRARMDLMNARGELHSSESVAKMNEELHNIIDDGLSEIEACLRKVRMPAKAKAAARNAIQESVEAFRLAINTKMRRKGKT